MSLKLMAGAFVLGAALLVTTSAVGRAVVPPAADRATTQAQPAAADEVRVAVRGRGFHLLRRHPRFHRGIHVYPRVYRPVRRYYVPSIVVTPRVYRASRCTIWHRRCIANWGSYNSNYWGCMRYHGCD